MSVEMLTPTTLQPGDRVAILSPAWAAPAYFPALHERAMERVRSELGLEPVEYPTTRAMNASPQERAADVNAAFADPSIRAIFAAIGGDDQIAVTPYLDPDLPQADPKPFFGYSDNTNILNWLWHHGVSAYHGGSTMVHLGPPTLDPLHLDTLKAALFGGGDRPLSFPTLSEDFGFDWSEPRSITESAPREEAAQVEFIGSNQAVRGHTWGGCMEVLDQLAWAGHLPDAGDLEGGILLLETSEIMPPPEYVGRWVRALGERGYLDVLGAVAFAQPVVQDRAKTSPAEVRDAHREAYVDYLLTNIARYREDLLVCVNLPFGHTRPQAVLPYGGQMTIDPVHEQVIAHFPASQTSA